MVDFFLLIIYIFFCRCFNRFEIFIELNLKEIAVEKVLSRIQKYKKVKNSSGNHKNYAPLYLRLNAQNDKKSPNHTCAPLYIKVERNRNS